MIWAFWGWMAFCLFAYIGRFGRDVPYRDDWTILPQLVGTEPVTLQWLWRQYNEHRIALPKLVILATLELSGGDFRSAGWVSGLTLIALVAALQVASRRLRGQASLNDVAFALLLLHPGQFENLLSAFGLHFICSVALAVGWLVLLVGSTGPLSRTRLGMAALILLGLPLCGANGVVFVPFLSTWLAWQALRGDGPSRRDWLSAGVALAAIAFAASYFVGYERVAHHPYFENPRLMQDVTGQFLTVGFGATLAHGTWPFSGMTAFALLAITALVLVWAAKMRPEIRTRSLGFLAFLLAMSALALGMGVRAGRWEFGGFTNRYVTLAAPLPCCIYLAWTSLGNKVVPTLLALSLCLCSIVNWGAGYRVGKEWAGHFDEFSRLAQHDVDPRQILTTPSGQHIMPGPLEERLPHLELARAARVGPYSATRLVSATSP